jgi:hypothetical protein
MLVAFKSVIEGKSINFSSRAVGIACIIIGVYFIVYIFAALLNSSYMVFLPLTELWALAFLVLGANILR